MRQYYFLATALPDLQLGNPPEISFSDFDNLITENLSSSDFAKTVIIRRFYDIQNLRSFWKDEELDFRGNLNSKDLEEAILSHQGLPDYVFDYLDVYDSKEKRLEHFPELVSAYFKNEATHAHGFLKKYLTFEHDWRLVFAGLRAKQLGRDISKELQFEDPTDDLVAQILAQKDAKTFVPPDGFEDLKVIFDEHAHAPLELYKALCEYRFHHVSDMLGTDVFSIDYILGFMVQLITAEKWIELDQQKGMEVVKKVMQFS